MLCGVKLVVSNVRFGRVPFTPESNVVPPVPFDRTPLSVKLPVPATTPFAARKSIDPAAPEVSVRSAFTVRSRKA